jgi:hypothetical protein
MSKHIFTTDRHDSLGQHEIAYAMNHGETEGSNCITTGAKITPLLKRLIASAMNEETILEALAKAVSQGDKDRVFTLASELVDVRHDRLSSQTKLHKGA